MLISQLHSVQENSRYFHFFTTFVSVFNPTIGEKTTQDYLSQLNKTTLADLVKVYQPDFEMFQYSTEGFY